jgi:23S rRNA (cytidine1920-2'-O)/16S rRNA (cytidine1409-2'-O)-methyltransferase
MDKVRLDKLMVSRGQAQSRARAVDLIKNGVLVAGEIVKDPSLLVMDDVTISLLKEDIPWVSRAGSVLAVQVIPSGEVII